MSGIKFSGSSGQQFFASVFGSGVDGNVTLDGVATFPGINKASNVYTLIRDQQVTNLTVNPGITLIAGEYRIFCQGTLTNNGIISYNGNPAAGSAPGAALGSGVLAGSAAGATGGTGVGAAAATIAGASNSSVGASGSGGSGTSGAGGVGTNPVSASLTWWSTVYPLLAGTVGIFGTAKTIGGGLSGASGAGDGVNSGGGGGSGGGTIGIVCAELINNGTISCNGGRGGDAAAGNCGGGGGGGGGLILIYYGAANPLGTLSAAAGGSGLGIGTGTNGGPGGVGGAVATLLQ